MNITLAFVYGIRFKTYKYSEGELGANPVNECHNINNIRGTLHVFPMVYLLNHNRTSNLNLLNDRLVKWEWMYAKILVL